MDDQTKTEDEQRDNRQAAPTVEDLLREFEATYGEHHYAETMPLQQAFESLKAANDPRAESVRYDILLFQLVTPLRLGQDKGPRFTQMLEGTDQNGENFLYPDLDRDFPLEALEHYSRRIDETTNDAQRAIYCDFLWTNKRWKQKNRIELVQKAVQSYLVASDTFLGKDNAILAVDAVMRALDLSLSVGSDDLIGQSAAAAVRMLEELDRTGQHRWMLEMFQFLIPSLPKLGDRLPPSLLLRMIESALAAQDGKTPDFNHMRRMFLDVAADAHDKLGNAAQAKTVRLRAAESYVEEAEWKRANYPSGNMMAASFYQSATRAFMNLGDQQERVEELKVKIRECHKAAEGEYTRFSQPLDIPKEPIERHLTLYAEADLVPALRTLGIDPYLTPRLQAARQTAQAQCDAAAFLAHLPVDIVRDGIVLRRIQDEPGKLDQHLELYTAQALTRSLLLSASLVLSPIMDGLVARFPDIWGGIETCLREGGLFSEKRVALIKNGAASYLRGDYIAAVHVLVFQVEGVLRDLVGALGLPTFTYRNRAMRERDLSDVIETLSQVKGMDEDFCALLRYFLADVLGANLRNEVGHAIAELEVFNKQYTEVLLMIFLRIALMRIEKAQPTNDEVAQVPESAESREEDAATGY